jgi:hypothetical protein
MSLALNATTNTFSILTISARNVAIWTAENAQVNLFALNVTKGQN